jgi:hypothetical protein
MISGVAGWMFLLSELEFCFVFLCFIAWRVFGYLNHLWVMVYLAKTKSKDYLAIGINLRLIIVLQLFPVCAITVLILSLLFAPKLAFSLFLALMVLPAPLYMIAAPSSWRYWAGATSGTRGENDPSLNNLRAQNKRVVRTILKLILIATCIAVTTALVGLILH